MGSTYRENKRTDRVLLYLIAFPATLGVISLGISIALYIYSFNTSSQLDNLNFSPNNYTSQPLANLDPPSIYRNDSSQLHSVNINSKIGSAPTHISIPAINVHSKVSELGIKVIGDSRTYETPNSTVGHIPESANPGERGAIWLFGHLESPLSKEGSVFYRLPEIPHLLRNKEDIHITLHNDTSVFVYKIHGTKVIHEDELILSNTTDSTVHLVSCIPRFIYDHRLVVSGTLEYSFPHSQPTASGNTGSAYSVQ